MYKRKLFIIGNGFDIRHGMNTKYDDFRDFLLKKYPDIDKYFDGILMTTNMPGGNKEYDMDEVVGSVVRTIDECSDPEWKNLEECLGNKFIENIIYDNEWVYYETDLLEDDSIFRSFCINEDMAQSIAKAYEKILELFEMWVFEDLASIDYSKIRRFKCTPSFRHSLFINFNYTLTLERIYGVCADDICYIHGNSLDPCSKIYFGHGDDEELGEFLQYMGIESAYNELKRRLRKNTRQAISENSEFFRNLKKVKRIYSYGFSFSDADKDYLEEICKNINPNKTTWFFNKYDWDNNFDYVKKISVLGFKVKRSRQWRDASWVR